MFIIYDLHLFLLLPVHYVILCSFIGFNHAFKSSFQPGKMELRLGVVGQLFPKVVTFQLVHFYEAF